MINGKRYYAEFRVKSKEELAKQIIQCVRRQKKNEIKGKIIKIDFLSNPKLIFFSVENNNKNLNWYYVTLLDIKIRYNITPDWEVQGTNDLAEFDNYSTAFDCCAVDYVEWAQYSNENLSNEVYDVSNENFI